MKVFDPNSVYLPTKKIGKNNPKAAEIEADNAARQDWNRTADMALVSGIAEAKIIEIRNEHVYDEATRSVQKHGWLPGLFKGKERKALQEKIARVQQEIDLRMDRLPGILKEDSYPDVQAFKRTYDAATALVEQYNRDLAAWERQVNGEKQPQQAPPEKESIRKKLRDMEAEAKRRNTERRQEPRHRSYDYDRGR